MLIAWLLVTFGVTIVITKSRIGAPLRRRFPIRTTDGSGPDDKRVTLAHLLRCPMCTGWWVGAALSPLHIRVFQDAFWVPSSTATLVAQEAELAIFNAFAAGAWCWAFWVVLAALGAERQ
jgi:hypothetical protein